MYQVADASGWTGTLTAPNVFAANETVRITVVHAGASAKLFVNGTLAVSDDAFALLDYSYADVLWIGKRTDDDYWLGTIGDVSIKNGSWAPTAGTLDEAERAALVDLYEACGGDAWGFELGTDAAGGGEPWDVAGGGDPCADGWFGVRCSDDGAHVVDCAEINDCGASTPM